MITKNNVKTNTFAVSEGYSELFGLSTDTKPTNVGNASIFYEMDTKKVFMFDAAGKTWHEQ